MRKFTDEEILAVHECLKVVNVTNKLPSPEEMDRYVNILIELLDILNLDEQLSVYLYMAHDTVLNIISERKNLEEETGIIEVD